MSLKNYQKLLKERRIWYKTITQYYCPILKENIIFNAKGFHHLLFDGLGHARTQQERIYRLNLLPLSIVVIATATSIHEYTPPAHTKSFNNPVEYWRLQARVGEQNTMVTVVLRKIGTGNIIFYSIWDN